MTPGRQRMRSRRAAEESQRRATAVRGYLSRPRKQRPPASERQSQRVRRPGATIGAVRHYLDIDRC